LLLKMSDFSHQKSIPWQKGLIFFRGLISVFDQ
jgi:hypothetical protein